MAKKKKLGNAKSLVELLSWLNVATMKTLSTLSEYACLKKAMTAVTASGVQDSDAIRHGILDELAKLSPADLAGANDDASRFLQMLGGYIDSLLRHAHHHLPPSDAASSTPAFDRSADRYTQLVWLRVHAPTVFDQMEAICMTRHFYGHKRYSSFNVLGDCSTDFSWDDQATESLQSAVIQALQLDASAADECEMIHFEVEDNQDGVSKQLHYLVLYHPGQMRILREIRQRKRSIHEYIPALEATVVYDPSKKQIHVLCARQSLAKQLADKVADQGLGVALSDSPVNTAYYDLNILKQRVDLTQANSPGATVDKAWLASLTTALGRSRHNMTIGLSNDENLWDVVRDHFGDNNPIASTAEVREAVLSFEVTLHGEDSLRSLDITVNADGKCSIFTHPDPRLRRVAEDLLQSLGILSLIDPPAPGSDLTQFEAEMRLLDIKNDVVDGYFLRSLNLTPSELLKTGMLSRKKPGREVTLRISTDGEDERIQTLPIRSNSTSIWAEDEFNEERFDLKDSDVTRYGINKGFLRERLLTLLESSLTDRPLVASNETDEPQILGDYPFGGLHLPVFLVTRLCDAKHADKMDAEMRRGNHGYSIILTSTSQPICSYLGPGLVIPLEKLFHQTGDGGHIDFSLAHGDIQRGQHLGESVEVPRVIEIDHRTAQLVGPWKQPWTLNRPDWIAVVRVLTNAWVNGRQQLPKATIEAQANVTFRYFQELFKTAPEWETYIRGADRKKRPRNWELAIGQVTYRPSADEIAAQISAIVIDD
ncbi:hypothetical protein CDEF62S_00614 [Castellaniella defragrans]